MAKQMVATETFRFLVNGFMDLFERDVTIVDSDEEVVKAHPDRFQPVAKERPEVEQATAGPGEKRGSKG